jgi:molybdate transport system substrate-binding protein
MLRYITPFLFFLWMLTSPAAAETNLEELPSITVLADRALTVPLSNIASHYSRTRQLSITVNFAPSFEQTVAIEEGEPADIFISAHPEAIKRLQLQGLFDVFSITPLVKSRLALISKNADFERQPEITMEYMHKLFGEKDYLLSVANAAATAEGYYTQKLIEKMRRKIFLSDNTVLLQNTEDILNFLDEKDRFGITLVPYAMLNHDLRQIGTFPEDWHSPVVFTGVAIAGTQMKQARDFLQYLRTAEAQRHFIKYNFYGVNAENL